METDKIKILSESFETEKQLLLIIQNSIPDEFIRLGQWKWGEALVKFFLLPRLDWNLSHVKKMIANMDMV